MKLSLAFFVTPHGFGHGARAAALMQAIHQRQPQCHFEIFTQVPEWVFEVSTEAPFKYHALLTDVGLAQKTPLVVDLPETVRRLDGLMPFEAELIEQLATQVQEAGCRAVLCDVAALGLAVAQAAGLPSVLIENFTWDWIYEPYLAEEPRLERHMEYLRGSYMAATHHFQVAPVCHIQPHATQIPPLSRQPRQTPAEVRQQLGLTPAQPLILLTMGGMDSDWQTVVAQLHAAQNVNFVIPGAGQNGLQREGNVLLLPPRSHIFHPDLLSACSAVVGKLGYSTLAETYYAGIPYAYVERPGFREYPVLAQFVHQEMQGLEIKAATFESGTWLRELPHLLALPRLTRSGLNGAHQIAEFIVER